MSNDKLRALISQIEQAMVELVSECVCLETLCKVQAAELKRLHFEARGMVDMLNVCALLPTPEEVGLCVLDSPVNRCTDSVMNQAVLPPSYFDIVIWRWVATYDVRVHG